MSAAQVTQREHPMAADAPRHGATAPGGLPESGVLEAAEAPALTVLGSDAAAVCTDGVCTL
ncbi:hypothetical protein ABZX77_28215 [Streptomyces sp. NPDC004237]|uniref:hypothetical protein n=1 Tax=Streptomyces sp. NPDC004237 TaxID=3154455 RepID=UPI0033B4A800